MSCFDLTLDTDHQAFHGPDAGSHVAQVLRSLADRLEGVPREALADMTMPLWFDDEYVGFLNINIDDEMLRAQAEFNEKDAEIRRFVKGLRSDQIKQVLTHACGIEISPGLTGGTCFEMLVNCLHDGDTTIDSIKGFYEGTTP